MNKVKQKKGFFPLVTGAARRGRTDYYDFNLLAVIVLLTCFGLIMLYSTSRLYGAGKVRG